MGCGLSKSSRESDIGSPHARPYIPALATQVANSLKVDQYFDKSFTIPDCTFRAAIQGALDNIEEKGLPPVAASPALGKFLMMQCKLNKVQEVLEVGTKGGYSAIWFGLGANCKVTSLESNKELAAVARNTAYEWGLNEKTKFFVGDVARTFKEIVEEISCGKCARPGLVYIDANMGSALAYFNLAVRAVGSGGIIVVDNMVSGGQVVDTEKIKSEPRIQGIRALTRTASQDRRVDATVIRTVAQGIYDGFLFAVVK